MSDETWSGNIQKDVNTISRLREERDALVEALETIRDAGLEPIDPAYRELARKALSPKDDGKHDIDNGRHQEFQPNFD